jgi:hypothetical protein
MGKVVREYNMNDLRGLSSVYKDWLNAYSNSDLTYLISNSGSPINFSYDVAVRLKNFDTVHDLNKDSKAKADMVNLMRSRMDGAGKTYDHFMSEFIG